MNTLPQRKWLSGANRVPQALPHYIFPPGLNGTNSVSASNVRPILLELHKSEWVGAEQEVKRFLVERFKEIPLVKSICAQFGTQEIIIWTLLETYDREAPGGSLRERDRGLSETQPLRLRF